MNAVLDISFPEHCQHCDSILVKISMAPLPIFKFARLRIETVQVQMLQDRARDDASGPAKAFRSP